MKAQLTILVLLLGLNNTVQAGWERISSDTIRLAGTLERNSYRDYLKVAEGGYSTLILRSGGGSPLVALMIAEDVASRNVSVVVDGYCMSACANYLAFSGKRLSVPCDSLLAWHGTIATPEKAVVRMRAQQEPEGLIEAYEKWLTDLQEREEMFYKKIGVKYRLLRDSSDIVREDGITPESGFTLDQLTGEYSSTHTAALWVPTPEVLRTYGVDTDGLCRSNTDEHVKVLLELRGIALPFTSRGTR